MIRYSRKLIRNSISSIISRYRLQGLHASPTQQITTSCSNHGVFSSIRISTHEESDVQPISGRGLVLVREMPTLQSQATNPASPQNIHTRPCSPFHLFSSRNIHACPCSPSLLSFSQKILKRPCSPFHLSYLLLSSL
jgi:hypothetical protein